jgi:hypothetical protein
MKIAVDTLPLNMVKYPLSPSILVWYMVAVVKRLTPWIVAPACVGSIPTSHPILTALLLLGRSQVGKARDFDSRMRWFESSRPSQNDSLAQLVEHLTFNQGVPGSNPGWITIFLRMWRNWQTH